MIAAHLTEQTSVIVTRISSPEMRKATRDYYRAMRDCADRTEARAWTIEWLSDCGF